MQLYNSLMTTTQRKNMLNESASSKHLDDETQSRLMQEIENLHAKLEVGRLVL